MAGVWFDGLLDVLGNFLEITRLLVTSFFVNAELTASDGFSSTISAELVNNSSSSRSDLAFRHFCRPYRVIQRWLWNPPRMF